MGKGENITYEVIITIINVDTVVKEGDNWTVMFNTTSISYLKIKAINGTTWSNEDENEDLKFLDLKCGEESVEYKWIDDVVSVKEYSCENTSYAINKRWKGGSI